MKTLIFAILTVLSYLSIIGCGIWAVVEFILYLVKDKLFNWTSIWCLIGGIVLMIVSAVFTMIFKHKEDREAPRRALSNFSKRLAEEQKKKELIKNN